MKYLTLLLLSTLCFAAEPRFHFMDCVKVTKGFYEGCKGNVTDYNNGYYHISSDDCKGKSFFDSLPEYSLEPAKGCQQ